MLEFAKFVMLLVVDCKKSSTFRRERREEVREIKFCRIITGLLNTKTVSAFLESYEFLEFESRFAKVTGK